jgi:hypothetical protein
MVRPEGEESEEEVEEEQDKNVSHKLSVLICDV